MGKFIEIIWLFIVVIELFVIIITYYYLKREYIKATHRFNEIMDDTIAKKKKAKKNTKKNIVKMNITQHIYAQEINERVGYAQLEFLKDGQYISRQKMTQDKIRIGRDYRNDIVITDLTFSRRQGEIWKRKINFE